MAATAAEIQALTQQIKLLTEGMKNLIGAQSQVTRSTVTYSDTVKLANAGLEDLEAEFHRQGNVSREQSRVQHQLIQAKRDEILLLKRLEQEKAALAKIDRDYANQLISAQEHLQRSNIERANIADTQLQLGTAQAEVGKMTSLLQTFGSSLGGAGKMLNVFAGIIGAVGGALVNYNTTFKEATLASAGVIEETTGSFDKGMHGWLATLSATGIASKEFIALAAANRQVVNSLGGMRATIDTAEESVKKTYGLYGSLEESWKQNLGVMTNFANLGVKPSIAALNNYNNDLDMLARTTGMLGPEMNNLFKSIASEADSIDILRAARAGERESILANQRALYISNRALGMTAEQAEAASKMLNRMVAAKPLERFKQAARLRAMGAMMGIDTNPAASELMKAKGQQNIAIINEGLTKVSTAIGAAAQQGVTAELVSSVAAEKLGFDELQRTFDVNLKDTNTSLLNLRHDYKSASDSSLMKVNVQIDIAKAMLKSALSGEMLLGFILGALDGLGVNILSIPMAIGDIFANVVVSPLLAFLQLLTKGLSYIPGLGNIMEGVSVGIGSTLAAIHQFHEDAMKTQQPSTAIAQIALAKSESAKQTAEIVGSTESINKPLAKIAPIQNGRSNAPGEALSVKVIPNPTTEGKTDKATDRAETLITKQLDESIQQGNKIDTQLKQMIKSNDYLKIIAESNPKLVELAEKQLAVSTMTQEQRDRTAKRLSSESAKFSADYSYAL